MLASSNDYYKTHSSIERKDKCITTFKSLYRLNNVDALEVICILDKVFSNVADAATTYANTSLELRTADISSTQNNNRQ